MAPFGQRSPGAPYKRPVRPYPVSLSIRPPIVPRQTSLLR